MIRFRTDKKMKKEKRAGRTMAYAKRGTSSLLRSGRTAKAQKRGRIRARLANPEPSSGIKRVANTGMGGTTTRGGPEKRHRSRRSAGEGKTAKGLKSTTSCSNNEKASVRRRGGVRRESGASSEWTD